MPTIRTVYTFDSWYQQSSTRISSNNVYPYDGFNHIQVNCTGVSKTLMWDFVGWDSNGNMIADYYWFNSETTIDIPTDTGMATWALWLKDANEGSITSEDVASCEAIVEETTVWIIGSNGLTNENFEPRIEYNMASPYPKGLWRITANRQFPWTELLPLQVELNPLPITGQGNATEITDTSSVEWRRYENKPTGYANPNLYRFQDNPYPENIRGHVGIYGTDSYQFMSIQLHDEESTTSEIP